jgi:hypothetical protein
MTVNFGRDCPPGHRVSPRLHGDTERSGEELPSETPSARQQDSFGQGHSLYGLDAGGGKTVADPGAGERIRTAGLPFTRSPALCSERSTCTDDTDHCTEDTHHAGISWRVGPRTGPRPKARPCLWVLLPCVPQSGASDLRPRERTRRSRNLIGVTASLQTTTGANLDACAR